MTTKHFLRRVLTIATAAMIATSALPLAAKTAGASRTQPRPPGASAAPRPWENAKLSADERVDLILKEMTLAEKLRLTFGYFSTRIAGLPSGLKNFEYPKDGLPDSAGFVPGIPRLGVPDQWLTDAGMGVATQQSKTPRLRTSLPSGIAVASTWNPQLAQTGGAMIGNEAFLSGFNVILAGAMNLTREPRNGRNFEYGGEDPLLAGLIVGHQIKGIQSQNVISTMKHFAFNDQETRRTTIDHRIGEQAARESDLLAFEIANEIGQPGSVMCSYNRINGAYACENDWLLNQVLKRDWNFKGYVMSDWGAVHSTTEAANAGLDQESGWPFDRSPYFADALHEAVNDGHVSEARATDMARRILRSMFASGLFDKRVHGDASATIDFAGHAAVTRAAAEEGIVLLKNTAGLLPLPERARTILIVGSHADIGVLSGGGSSQVYPHGGPADGLAVPNEGPKGFPGPKVYFPSSPMKALRMRGDAIVTYLDGKNVQAASAAAGKADIVILFAEQWMGEGQDARDLHLPNGQDALIDAVASANKNTVVVLETGGPVLMPWLSKAGAVIEAWYAGTSGGDAIARVLTGEANPSGHLPVTFPASLEQLPRPAIEGLGTIDPNGHPTSNYDIDGAAVGYKWFERTGAQPLFSFGYGLSYTRFAMSGLTAAPTQSGVTVRFVVKNTGRVRGKAVPQIYVSGEGWEAPRRLGAFAKVDLAPGANRRVTLSIDPRLLATFDAASQMWRIKGGIYKVMLASSAAETAQSVTVQLPAATFGKPER